MNSTDRQIQMLKNQQVILLALKTLIPDEPLHFTLGDNKEIRPNEWLFEVLDKCVNDTNNLMPFAAEDEDYGGHA